MTDPRGRIDEDAVGRRYADWFSRGLRGIGMRYVFSRRGLWVINTPFRRILRAANITPADRVLDLGCGIGNLLIAIAERISFERPPVGVDVSPTLIELGRREIDRSGLAGRIELRVAPATSLPFADASFDVVLSSHVVKHLDEEVLSRSLREVARVLRPRGRFLLWEFKKSRLSALLFVSARATGLPPPFVLRSEATLRRVLSRSGFAQVDRVAAGLFILPPVPRLALLATRDPQPTIRGAMVQTATDTMRAIAVTPKQAGSAQQVLLQRPRATPGVALMRVLEVGIDGTDTEINDGDYGEAPPGSNVLVIGHEALSVIEAVGDGVKGFAPGDLVVSTVRRPDTCPNCEAGESDMCLYGNYTERGIKGAHGYMADYYSEQPAFMVKIPPPLRAFAVLLEPLSIVEKATFQAWKIQERLLWQPRRAVVLGAGPIGILCTILLRLRGLEVHVYAKTPADSVQAQLIRSLDASYEGVDQHPVTAIKAELGQIDFILEGTGNSSVAFQAMAQLGTNGILCLTGVSAGNRSIEIPSDVINLEMVLGNRVAFGSVNANRRYFEMGVQHFQQAEERWPGLFERLITRRVPFEDFKAALDRRPEDIKTLLTIADQ